ncbi:5-oxoprolinase subunit PxpB [Algoriphagus formosus]|uniref:5-oxoprolinase subunit PxpB n=1 Tax=Algoriphagus formosus TaxID=2007308 RepID=A0A4R5US31_9BACT|nr:5-oxoprolinase subunit PxpB [Algoriphagus aquimaris]TDK41909.1 5-oxoprolinase subunit PxpB [Algoriphagus aquimaris]
MVVKRPELRKITPRIWELFWEEEPSSSLRNNRISIKNWLENQYHSELLEIRQGYQTISIVWKNEGPEDFYTSFPEYFNSEDLKPQTWEIPVCYGENFGKDLDQLCTEKAISKENLIQIHSQSEYVLEFYGFLPGFMYLSGLHPDLISARKSIPDRKVEAGSVAIGGKQTGIYPLESPGGWHVIGKTPIQIFDKDQNPPVNPQPGDFVRFYPISEEEFDELSASSKTLGQS